MNLNKIGYAYTPFKASASNRTGNIISVTREHIRRGKISDCQRCPVALALLEAHPDAVSVSADADLLVVNLSGGRQQKYRAPRSVERFINKFDNSSSGQPFRFKLEKA